MQAAVRISQSPVRSHVRPASVRVSCKGNGATGTVAPSLCSTAFLNQKIADIRPDDSMFLSQYGISIDSTYDHVLKCCKRFSRLTKMKFDFQPDKTMTKAQDLDRLISQFGDCIRHFGLEFFVGKKRFQGEEAGTMECAVYRAGVELDGKVVVLYVSPARYLSPRSAELFKRFMKFFSESTHIPLGIDNFYLDSILSMYEDDPYYSELTEDDDDYPEAAKRRSISAAYNEDGEFWNLFDEIRCLPKQNAKELYDDLDKYRKNCPQEELGLMEAIADGIGIVKDMNAWWFDFNPANDGLPDGYGNINGDCWSSAVVASAILYSEHDGMSDMLMDAVNDEVNAGVGISGWNMHQYLSLNIGKPVVDEFMACKDNVVEFSLWLQRYYIEMEKFDRYGKSEEHPE